MTRAADRYQEIFAAATEPMLLLDEEKLVSAVNAAARRLTGYSEDDLVGQSLQFLLPAATEEGQALINSYLQTAAAGTRQQIVWQLHHAQGRSLSVGVTLSPLSDGTLLISLGRMTAEMVPHIPSDTPLLDGLPLVIFSTDEEGRLTYVNRAWANITGYSINGTLGTHFLEYILPDDRERAMLLFEQLASGMETEGVDTVRFVTEATEVRWIEAFVRVNRGDAGAFLGSYGTFSDVTERVQLDEELHMYQETLEQMVDLRTAELQQVNQELETEEQALQKQRSYLRQILDTIPHFIYAKDAEGRFTLVNRALADAYDTTAEAMVGKTEAEVARQFVGPGDSYSEDLAVLISGKERHLPEDRMVDAEGNERWLSTVIRPLQHAGEKDAEILGVATDITERRLAEAERERLAAIVQGTSDFIGIATPDGTVIFLNDAGYEMVGLAPDAELSQLNITQFHPPDVVQLMWEEAFPYAIEHGTWQGEGTVYGVDGELTPISIVLVVGYADSGEPAFIAATFRDISEILAAEAELAERLHYEQALALASRQLLSDDPDALSRALEILQKQIDVSLVNLVQNAYDGAGSLGMVTRYSISAASGVRQLARGRQQVLPYDAAGFARWRRLLSEGNVVAGPIAGFPAEERALLATRDVGSVIALPLHVEGEWYGYLALEDEREREWSEEEIRLLQTAADLIGSHLTRQQLQRRVQALLQRRGRQVAISADLARDIAAAVDLKELYLRVVEEINEAFGYYFTQLLRYDPAQDALVMVAGSGEVGEKMLAQGHMLPVGVGLVGRAAARGRSLLTSDVGSEPQWRPNPLLPDTHGELAVPVKIGDTVLGVLDVQSDTPSALDEDDQALLEGLSGQIAIAIESTRLRQELEEQLQELSNLQRLTSREAWLRYQRRGRTSPPGYHFDRQAVQTVQSPAASESGGDSNGNQVKMPLVVRGERVGTLAVLQEQANPLTEEEQQLLEVFSAQVAEAMESARLLEQTQKRAVELETVSRVSTATSTILEADKLLQAVVELTKRSFGLYHAHIYLLNDERGAMVLAAGAGDAGATMVAQGWSIPLDHPASVVTRAARERSGQIVNDVLQEKGFLPNPILPDTRSELAVPMIIGNRLVGVLDVQSESVNAFGDEDVQIQSALATQVTIALQNAMLYQEQLEASEQLREFDRLKSEFLASMSHELRTPLNSIIGFADVMLEGIDGELNERMEEDVRLIRNSGEHLRNLIGDILDMSKIEAGMMDLRYEPIDVRAMEPEINAFVRTQMMAYDKELAFDMTVGPEVVTVDADRTRFKQVLFNLLSNAVKFTSKGEVQLRMNRDDDKLVVAVHDTGIGLSEEHIPIIFEQFRQVDGSLTRTAGGTGLGLPISKSLVELHHGDIWVESRSGRGTIFYFTIPIERPAERKHGTGPLAGKS